MEPLGAQAPSFSSPLRPTAANRRRTARQKVHTPAYASMRGKSTAIVLDLNEVLDISEEGLCFQGPAQLEFGRSLEFNLDLSENNVYIPAVGRVVWSEPAGRTGVAFVRMSGPSLQRLKEWLFVNTMVACAHYVEARQAGSNAAAPAVAPAAVQPPPQVVQGPGDVNLSALESVQHAVEQLGPDLNSALQLIAGRALSLTGATGAAIAISEGEHMVCRGSAGDDAPGLGARLQIGSGFSGECVRTGLFLTCDDTEEDSRVDRGSCRALGIRSIAAAPVRSGESVIGLLEVFSPLPGGFGDGQRLALHHLAYIILGAVQQAVDALEARARLSEATVRFAESEASRAAPEPNAPQVSAAGPSSAQYGSGGTNDPAPPAETLEESRNPAGRRFFSPNRGLAILAIAAVVGSFVVFLAPAVWSHWRVPSEPIQFLTAPTLPSPTLAAVSDWQGLQRLAQQGDATAQFALGAHFATGEGVPQDYTQAAHWFSLAAEQGHVVAQATLGAYYWAGRGVTQDLSKAYFWSILAQSGGDEASKYRVEALASRLSREEIISAQQQANEWLAQHGLTVKDAANTDR